MAQRSKVARARLLCGSAAVCLSLLAGAASAQVAQEINITPQPLATALYSFAGQTGDQVMFSPELTNAKLSGGVTGVSDPQQALRQLLAGTGLTFQRKDDGYLIVRLDQDPQGGSAGAAVEALIVTAQKREEDIQDVPIAISAFSQEDLTRSQIAGGPDLITQIPNFTFTKTNFTGYSIQIRGIGTQAISATTDPAVAVAFNNTPFVRNHFFEQEFYDLERVEVLRGPQGTLYGRNATAGVVNVISAKPKFVYEARASADVSNYNSTRIEGMVNIPLVEDAVALRLAGAWTKRDGYAFNQITGAPIDGRDLWSTRLSLRFAPADAPFDVNLIWEHFEENDDRLRSGKQLCKTDRPTEINGVPLNLDAGGLAEQASTFSQGCTRVSLYSPEAFQVPNGFSIPYYQALQGIGLPLRDWDPTRSGAQVRDPYISTTQSPDLRVIESTVEPEYRAKADTFELQANFDISDNLTLTSETSYSTDELFSKQDLNRFNTTPGVFANSHLERNDKYPNYALLTPGPNGGGIWCDPQIGCADRLVAVDLSTGKSVQFSEELRLASDFDGPFNFSVGANFLRFDVVDKYYVFINTITLAALNNPFWNVTSATGEPPPYVPNVTDNRDCMQGGQGPYLEPRADQAYSVVGCVYVDPNPIGSLNDLGHNYFLSKNPYKLISYAVFGEAYYDLTDNLKITAGLRLTVDRKQAPRIPSWLLAADTIGHPVADVVNQEWREPTGRLTLDWKPDLSFTDETLLYASYAHGYKAGGANPPAAGVVTYNSLSLQERLATLALFPRTFEPEFIDAYEIGSKNTLFDGRVTFNTAAFYYDYKGYQISEIVERAALNRNFDAKVWGLEVEADWRPLENLRLSLKTGYQDSRLADNQEVIDLMDRTAGRDDDGDGNPDWVVARPFPAIPSNCVVPVWLVTYTGGIFTGNNALAGLCRDIGGGLDPVTSLPYVPNPTVDNQGRPLGAAWAGYPGYDPRSANGGAGFPKDVGGNELPNAPHYTVTLSGDYTLLLPNDWTATLRTDLHWQSKSWWRVFQDHDYARLDDYFTMNLAAIFANEESGWNVMAYVKNVTDETAITGAFLYSDDTGLVTNVFLTEPRLYGLRVTKAWSGGPLLGGFGARHDGPYPFTLELGGQVQRHDTPYESLAPTFATAFPQVLDPLATQHQDLDWGDGREVKLTYRPQGPWSLSLDARFGKTNGTATSLKAVDSGGAMCTSPSGPTFCDRQPADSAWFSHVDNYSNSTVVSGEDHTVVDFVVGYDVGLGALADLGMTSQLAGGLRYAELNMDTRAHMFGTPDWNLPPYLRPKYPTPLTKSLAQHTEYEASVAADREFKGVGPVASVDLSRQVIGTRDTGFLNADLSLAGGVLFGKRKTSVIGSEQADYFDAQAFYGRFAAPTSSTTAPIEYARSKSVTVPVLDVSLGLSYRIDRFSIGAGYRWERYFDAIDGGFANAEDADRTVDGPYFKLAVGFGG